MINTKKAIKHTIKLFEACSGSECYGTPHRRPAARDLAAFPVLLRHAQARRVRVHRAFLGGGRARGPRARTPPRPPAPHIPSGALHANSLGYLGITMVQCIVTNAIFIAEGISYYISDQSR